LWQNEQLKSSVSSYAGFCQLLGLDKAQRYLASRNIYGVKDWGLYELDAEGLSLQNELEERIKVRDNGTRDFFLLFLNYL
jgi:exportin-5